MTIPFIPGYPPSPSRLLARFLPPLAEGVAAHYIEQYSGPGDLLLDPFGQAPGVAIEALHLGRRVLVSNFNPVSSLALSLAVRPPTEVELRSALTLLGDAPTPSRAPRERGRGKDGDRLENYLRGLYRTACADCGAEVSADAFDWEADPDDEDGAGEPVEKIYLCPRCGPPHKQHPTSEADRALAERFTRGLDYHFLLDRVTPLDDPDRVHAQEALAVYPPRALAALAAALVKLDSAPLRAPPETRRLLGALFIAACDAACALSPDRPKALAVPKRYREVNFWLAMEKATGELAGRSLPDRSLPLTKLIGRADGPALYAHTGHVRDLIASLPPASCALVISALPRPTQAYWTLSALWSAWLWGRESAAALRSVLRRRRYDWSWHSHALNRTITVVLPVLAPAGKLIGLMPEAEPGFVGGLLAATDGAGCALAGAVLRADTAEAQFVWEPQKPGFPEGEKPGFSKPMLETAIKNTAQQAAVETLRVRGEPSRWMTVHFGAWRGLAQSRLLAASPDDAFSAVSRLLDPVFRDPHTFQRLGAEAEDDLSTGLWVLSTSISPAPSVDPSVDTPLADRVESKALRLLSAGEAAHEHDLIREVCAAFPGVQTPGRGLVLACLSSYAQKIGPEVWQLRPEDASAERAKELESIQAELRALAVRNGYDVAGANPQEWREDGQTVYLFAVITSAVISGHFLGPQIPARRRFLVLPGGRAGLAAFKLRRDPRLRAALVSGNWIIVKFRHVRRMAGDAHLTRATLEPALAGDPLEEAKQLSLMADG